MTYTAEDIQQKSDFGLKIDFGSNRQHPARFFVALSRLIEFCEYVDQTLANSFDASLEPTILLEDLEKGSLLIWLKMLLESLDDEALRDLNIKKLFGKYAVRAKYILIDFLAKKTTISNANEIKTLQAELINEYEEVFGSSLSPIAINQNQITDCIQKYQESLADLQEGDRVYYLSPSDRPVIEFNRVFNVAPETLEDIITKEIIVSELTMILKIKKPDYLGDSKWQFKHGKKTMEMKILDDEWLHNFRMKQVIIAPGDSLRAIVKSEVKYDFSNDVISEKHEILKILEVIEPEIQVQQELPVIIETQDPENH